jgi:hypothetical protein
MDAGTAERSVAARLCLVALNPGEAHQRCDLANRRDGGLMIDLVDPDRGTADWLTEVFAAAGVLRSGSVVSCAAEPLAAMCFAGGVLTAGAQL